MNQHYGSKFQCEECLKCFSRKDILKEHRRRIHVEKISELVRDGHGNDSDVSYAEESESEEKKSEEANQDEVVLKKTSKLKCEAFGRKYHLKRH